jgi:hypothetical protein
MNLTTYQNAILSEGLKGSKDFSFSGILGKRVAVVGMKVIHRVRGIIAIETSADDKNRWAGPRTARLAVRYYETRMPFSASLL